MKEMKPPNQSLEDFTGKSSTRKPTEPPPEHVVRPSGIVTRLDPLARYQGPKRLAIRRRFIRRSISRVRYRNVSWFHLSFAISSGLAIFGLIFISVMFVKVFEPRVEPLSSGSDVAENRTPESMPPPVTKPDADELVSTEDSLPSMEDPDAERPVVTSRHSRPRLTNAAYRQRRRTPRPQFVKTDFVPTLLVIYAENGVVKSRIEPQLTASYTKQPPIPN